MKDEKAIMEKYYKLNHGKELIQELLDGYDQYLHSDDIKTLNLLKAGWDGMTNAYWDASH